MVLSEDLISRAAGLAAAVAALAAALLAPPPANPRLSSSTGGVISAMVVRDGAGQAARATRTGKAQEPLAQDTGASRQDVQQKPAELRGEPKSIEAAPALPEPPKPRSAAVSEAKPREAVRAPDASPSSAREKPVSNKPGPEMAKPRVKPAKKDRPSRRDAANRPAAKPDPGKAGRPASCPAAPCQEAWEPIPPAGGEGPGADRVPSRSEGPAGRPSGAQAQAMARKVRAELARSLIYPRAASRRGIEGRVMVRFEIRGGRVVSSSVVSGSGSPILDEAARKLAASITGFKAGEEGDLGLEVPIEYRLF